MEKETPSAIPVRWECMVKKGKSLRVSYLWLDGHPDVGGRILDWKIKHFEMASNQRPSIGDYQKKDFNRARSPK